MQSEARHAALAAVIDVNETHSTGRRQRLRLYAMSGADIILVGLQVVCRGVLQIVPLL